MIETNLMFMAFGILLLGVSIGALVGIALMHAELKETKRSLDKQRKLIKKMKG